MAKTSLPGYVHSLLSLRPILRRNGDIVFYPPCARCVQILAAPLLMTLVLGRKVKAKDTASATTEEMRRWSVSVNFGDDRRVLTEYSRAFVEGHAVIFNAKTQVIVDVFPPF